MIQLHRLKMSPILLMLLYDAFYETFSNPMTRFYRHAHAFRCKDHRQRLSPLRLRGGRACSLQGRVTGSRTDLPAIGDDVTSEPQLFGQDEETQVSNFTGDDTHLRDGSGLSDEMQEIVIRVRRMTESRPPNQPTTSTDPENEGAASFTLTISSNLFNTQ